MSDRKSRDWWNGWLTGVLTGTLLVAVGLTFVLGLFRVGVP